MPTPLPEGRLALCAWLDSTRPDNAAGRQLVAGVCRGMLCPSLARLEDYAGWMRSAGLEVTEAEDITPRVARTWDLCLRIARRPWVRFLLWFLGAEARAFVAAFDLMHRAFAEGAMGYGWFIARKP